MGFTCVALRYLGFFIYIDKKITGTFQSLRGRRTPCFDCRNYSASFGNSQHQEISKKKFEMAYTRCSDRKFHSHVSFPDCGNRGQQQHCGNHQLDDADFRDYCGRAALEISYHQKTGCRRHHQFYRRLYSGIFRWRRRRV